MSGPKKKLLITGASGLLGWNLYYAVQNHFDTYGQYHTTPVPGSDPQRMLSCDLLAGSELERLIERLAPDGVVHAAAMTRPGECESKPDQALAINAEVTRRLAVACENLGARLIHISTDLVFDGLKGSAYLESDPVNPITQYALTKVKAEEAVTANCRNAVIVRAALMYGRSMTGDRGTAEWIVNTVRDQGRINLFTDEWRTPVLVEDLCEAIPAVMALDATGIFHAGGGERISRYDFGLRLAERAGFDPEAIAAASLHDFKGAARTPDASLDSSALTALIAYSPRSVIEGLDRLYPSS